MNCPYCKSPQTRTTYTRHDNECRTMRWKKCKKCEHKWFTVEWPLPREAISHCRDEFGASGLRLNPGYQEIYFAD